MSDPSKADSPLPVARAGTTNPDVEKTRAITGVVAVVAGDVVIALAAILSILFATRGSVSSSALPQVVAILSSGFTAIATLTTAYFGLKSVSNTASNLASTTRPSSEDQ